MEVRGWMADGDSENASSGGSRRQRWFGLGSIAADRVWTRATGSSATRIGLVVAGVAVSVALVLVITGVSLGLADAGTVEGDDVNYWIVPGGELSGSALVDTGGPSFGGVHAATERIERQEGVEYATPVLVTVLQADTAGENREFVIVIGIVSSENMQTVAGLPVGELTPNDPFYAEEGDGSERTGEAVIAPATAEVLGITDGDEFEMGGESFTVVGEGTEVTGIGTGDLPVVVVQLSELQVLTGADAGDRADQFLVSASDPAVRGALEAIYPEADVTTRAELLASGLSEELPFAMGVAALVIGVFVGSLFVLTTMGLEVATDRRRLATLGAIGVSFRSRLALVGIETGIVTLVGALIGGVVGLLGIFVVNRVARATALGGDIAVFHPVLVGYALVIAVVLTVIAIPYLGYLLATIDPVEGLR